MLYVSDGTTVAKNNVVDNSNNMGRINSRISDSMDKYIDYTEAKKEGIKNLWKKGNTTT
jgi:hypothetical protein